MKLFNVKTLVGLTALLLCLGGLSSATAAPRNPMLNVHRGMTHAQVTRVLGYPYNKQFFANTHEEWYYAKRGYHGRPFHTKVIVFKKGRVVALFDKKPHPGRHYFKGGRGRHMHPRHRLHSRPCPPVVVVPSLCLGFSL